MEKKLKQQKNINIINFAKSISIHIAPVVSFSLAWTLPAQTTDLYLLDGSSPIPARDNAWSGLARAAAITHFQERYGSQYVNVLKGCIVWPFMNVHVFAYLSKMLAYKWKNYGGGVGWNGHNDQIRIDLR